MARLGLDPRGEDWGDPPHGRGPVRAPRTHLAKIAAHVAALWVTHVTSVWLGLLGPTDTDR
jgi:hypothetical protein